ncbi:MAG: hypothetical protein J6U54_13565 [Clostridiales bacterium]|nr:hypothetical protein [Clostridiales bacterium]
MITSIEFTNAAIDIYNKLNTSYAKGGYGQYIDQATFNALCKQYSWNKQHLSSSWIGTYATDCICWIKGLLSGWRYNVKITPAMYCKTIPDFTDAQWGASLTDCVPISEAKAGYGLWKKGHAGICIGNGYTLDSNYSLKNGKVVENGLILRKLTDVAWEKAGKCPYIDYSDQVKVGDIMPMIITKIEGNKAYGVAEISPAPAPVPVPVITVGSKVTINPGAKSGGTNKQYRGKPIDPKYANGKYVATVVQIETHYGIEEALLDRPVWSWIATSSLKLVQ